MYEPSPGTGRAGTRAPTGISARARYGNSGFGERSRTYADDILTISATKLPQSYIMNGEPTTARLKLEQAFTLDDWSLLRDVLGLVHRSGADTAADTRRPTIRGRAATPAGLPLRTWSDIAKCVNRNRAAIPRRLSQLSPVLARLTPEGRGALLGKVKGVWALTALGKRALAAAESLLGHGLEAALDILCGTAPPADAPVMVSAAEAVGTYLLPYLSAALPRYDLLPWEPYMTISVATELLLSHRADLVIGWADGATPRGTIGAQDFGPPRGVCVLLHHQHPVAQRRLARDPTASAPLTAADLADGVFAAPLDTHLAATAASLINALGGGTRVRNVGRFPQAITHVRLTGAFSIFPDWPWCLRALRREAGVLAFPLAGEVGQRIRLRALWRAAAVPPAALTHLRQAVAATYDRLCADPLWRLTPLDGHPPGLPHRAVGESVVHFRTPRRCAVSPAPGWVDARVEWTARREGSFFGQWSVSEDQPIRVGVAVQPTPAGSLVRMTGAVGEAFSAVGLLAHTATRPDRPAAAVGTLTFPAAGGELVTTACVLCDRRLEAEDLHSVQDALAEVSSVG